MATKPTAPKFTKPKTTKPKGPTVTKVKRPKGIGCRAWGAAALAVMLSGCATTGAAIGSAFPELAEDEQAVVDALTCLDAQTGPDVVNLIANISQNGLSSDPASLIGFLTNSASILQMGWNCLDGKFAGDALKSRRVALRAKLDERVKIVGAALDAKVKDLRVKAAALPSPLFSGGKVGE